MAKDIPLGIIDSMLDLAEGDQLHICSAQPTTYTEATTTFQLATFTVTGGDYTKANGDVSGRKNTLAALTGATIDNTGTATHAAATTAGDTTLRLVTTTTSQALTAGGTVDTSAFAHEIQQAT
jgi:hypothetical protein